jgi:class 3 adenylate cyclase/predicted ATPase
MDTITTWLRRLGLEQYATTFIENAIDIKVLPDLTERDFERLNVALGHRKRMLRAVAELSRNAELPADSSTPPTAVPHVQGERRQLTILFCDLVGSTELSVLLDPEDLSAVIRKFQRTCAGVIAQHGGSIASYMGDGLLAHFGYPEAHEDDGECAVRAGLDLVARVGQLLLPSNEALRVRIGIATGVVLVGDVIGGGTSREHGVIGETPNLASRMQSLAQPNTVVVSASTRRLLGDAFVCEDLGLHELKGISEPVRVWRITGERAVESRFDAKRSGNLTQFVGRQSEFEQLMYLWHRAKAGEAQIALLCGEPGIGKSRLCTTVFEQIMDEPHIVIRLQCSPRHINSPFYPVISQLERATHFEGSDSADVKLKKLENLLKLAGQATLADAPLFATLLSIPAGGHYPSLSLTPDQQKNLTIAALIRQLLGLALTQPLLFVVEDVHWIDPSTLDLIGRTIKAIKEASILCLITFRPEFVPPSLEQSNLTKLRLDRLQRDQAHAMIVDIAGGKALPADVYEQIISKTDGVPLFVEELTKMVLESGLLRDAGDRFVNAGSLLSSAIPTTLHDSLMARLDRLAPIKEIAQVAAAIGREFSYRLLATVAPASGKSLPEALAQLTAAEIIFSHGEPPDSRYIFKHALVQDAAYSSLLRETRQQLHGRIAKALEDHLPGTVETQPELIAHHCAQAGLNRKAIEYLRLAGQRAIERSANPEAIGHLKRALEMLHSLPADFEHAQVALKLEVMLAQAMIAGRGYSSPETMKVLLRAKKLITEATETSLRFTIFYGMWACYYVGGEVDMQHVTATEFLAEAENHNDTAALCLAHRALGTTYVTMGEFSAGRKHLERAQRIYDPDHHLRFRFQYGQDIGTTVMCYLSWALWHLGHVDQASQLASEAVKRAEEISHPFTLVYTLCHARGMMDVFRRRSEDAKSYAGRVTSLCSEHEFPFWAAGGQIFRGWAAINQGEVDAGVDELIRALAAWRKTGARLWLPIFLALEAEGHFKAGRNQAALHSIDQALATVDETGERWAVAEILRVKANLLLSTGQGRPDEVERLLINSVEIAQRQQALCWELRTSCDLARLWQEQGRSKEALKLLRTIYGRFTEGFETADLQHAKALIEGLNADSVMTDKGSKKPDTRKHSRIR